MPSLLFDIGFSQKMQNIALFLHILTVLLQFVGRLAIVS